MMHKKYTGEYLVCYGRKTQWRNCGLTVLGVVVSLLTVTACSYSHAANGRTSHVDSVTQVVRHEKVLLLPPIEGGVGGWCIATKPGECSAARAFQGPIVAQVNSGQGPPPVQVGIVLVTSDVAGISVDGGPPIPTRTELALPDHLRAAVVEIRDGPLENVPGFRVGPRSLNFTPLNSNGASIHKSARPNGSLVFAIPSRRWRSPANPPRGICEIGARHLEGLIPQGGVVVSHVEPHTGLVAQPLLACVSIIYRFEGSLLLASVLLDATHPGSTPRPLPAMQPLAGHPGIFQAVGGAFGGLGSQGRILARRIAGAWLIVAEGSGLRQRLTLLEHLRASVHL